MITFPVSDVLPADGRRPATTLKESLGARSTRIFQASACNVGDLVASRAHGFVAAVHTAFALHHPLVLSPDDVWLCLAQGFATHVKLHAEALRDRFVRHEGKAQIRVRRDDFKRGSPSNDWPAVLSELSDRIGDHVGKKSDLIVADFSTTGPVERAASQVVLLDALQSYFEYGVTSLCGIPRITLLGTPDDWLWIRYRAEVFAELDMTAWTTRLLPILDRIARTARGDTDPTFWRSFYKYNDESGGPFVTGWINVLFPYLDRMSRSTWQIEPSWNEAVTHWKEGMRGDWRYAPSLHDFPTGLSSAPFIWDYLETEIPMVFVGGFVGVSQEAATGAVRPAIGWAVGEQGQGAR